MSSFTKIPAIADVSESKRCSYTGVAESRDPGQRCRFTTYHLHPASGHCSRHLTDEEIATVLPRIRAWRDGMEDLYGAVTTMTGVRLPNVSVQIEVTET